MDSNVRKIFDELLENALPPVHRKRTFFEIGKTGTKELVISRWYGYYLNAEEDHGLGNLFLSTLLKLAEASFEIEDYSVSLEVSAEEKFIDILIKGRGKYDNMFVIIENKIHHGIENALRTYYDHWDTDASKKLGVLVTLKPAYYKDKDIFKNILHFNWLEAVRKTITSEVYELDAEQKHNFNNFYHTLKNLNRFVMMTDEIAYYLNNTEKINQLIGLKDDAKNYITGQLEVAAERLNAKITNIDSPRLRSFELDKMPEGLSCQVIFENIFTAKRELRISIGLVGKAFDRRSELADEFGAEIKNAGMEVNYHPGKEWYNLISKRYKLTNEELSRLGSIVANDIDTEIVPLIKKVKVFLDSSVEMTEPPVSIVTDKV